MKTLGLMKRAEIMNMVKNENSLLKLESFLIEKVEQGLVRVENGQVVEVKNIKWE